MPRYACLAIAGVGLTVFGCDINDGPFEVKDVVAIERSAHIKVPASAKNLHCATGGFQDRCTYGRFDIPKADLAAILADSPVKREVKSYGSRSARTFPKFRETWWQTELLQHKQLVEGIPVTLLFGDMGNPEILTVYFCSVY